MISFIGNLFTILVIPGHLWSWVSPDRCQLCPGDRVGRPGRIKQNVRKKSGLAIEIGTKKFVYDRESLYLQHLDTYFYNLNQINYGR